MRRFLFLTFILLIFAIFLAWPIVQVVRVGFQNVGGGFTLAYVAAVFRDEGLRQGLINSIAIAIGVTIVCAIVAIPLAMLSVKYEFAGKRVVSSLLLVPLILPPFVGAIGMRQMLGRFGVLTAVAQDVHLVPQ